MLENIIIKKFSEAQDSLVIQQSDFSLLAIYQMVENNSIDIAPHYQRRDRWDTEKQSALIESFLLNVPVPPVYLSEEDYGNYSVIDGKQRITAICDFLQGKLRLRKLKDFSEIEGLRFSQLPRPLQNALSIRPFIRVITLLKQSDPKLKYEVFLRLNTGGDKLKPQEIRNVAYSGPLNDLLFKLAESPFLKKRLKITSETAPAYRNMYDLEHVLRFLTIRENWGNLGGVLTVAMDNFMAKNRYEDSGRFRDQFLEALEICERLWGEHAFSKPNNNGWREQLISPLYDAQMVAVSLLGLDYARNLYNLENQIIQNTKELYSQNQEFVKSVSQSTNNPSSIEFRVNCILKMLTDLV